jgi:uncharacterized phage infection (PIP) family protein YhgE
MTVTYRPTNLKGITAGALRQVKQRGATVSAGGLLQARETNKKLNDFSGKMRDGADKLNSAIEKFNKVTSNTNFAETAKHAELLVNSLERLAVLEASGTLDKVMKAMSK